MIKHILIALALFTPISVAAETEQQKPCYGLYLKGWNNMDFFEQTHYVLWCKPAGYK